MVLYDVAAQKEVAAYDVRIGVTALGFSRDGTRLVFAPIVGPRSLSVIDLASGARHDVLRPTRVIHSLAFGVRADRVWLAHDHGVRDFDLDRAIDVLPPAGHIGEITALAFSPDGKTLASGSSDATIRLWDLATGGARLLEILTETWGVGSDLATFPLGPLTELWWSADGKLLNSIDGVGSELRARVWNAEDGAQREARHARAVAFDGGAAVITDAMRAAHAGNVSATALAPDGKTVATGGRDGQVFVWP